jgi:hypothetical protein
MKALTSRFGLLRLTSSLCQASLVLLLGMTSRGAETAEVKSTPAPEKAATGSNEVAEATEPGVKTLFDGKTLKGWKITDFGGQGEVTVENGRIVMEMGNDMTGITWTNDVIKMDYEISLDAMRVDGSDFFCGLTFPVQNDPCSLILGGWGGGLVGLSSLDGNDASSNETTKMMHFENGRWYHVRLRVTPEKIEAWLDKDKIINASIKDRRISVRIEVEGSKPLGIACWRTKAAVRNIKVRAL